jgi:CRP-like cAMP-binding protein
MTKPQHPAPTTFKLAPGQYLFNEGDPSTCLYIVKSGSLSVEVSSLSHSFELSTIKINEVVGELAFFDRKPRSASVVALEESEVVQVDYDALEKIYANVPDYLKSIMAGISHRLRRSNERMRELELQLKKS